MLTNRDQGGFTLIESVISVMLTAMVILALASGLLAVVRSSEVAKRIQRADSALSSFSESLKTAPYPLSSPAGCPSLAEFQSNWDAYVAGGEGWTDAAVGPRIVGVQHWDPAAGEYAPTCPTDPDDKGFVDRLTIEVTISGRSRTAQVVVSPT